MPELNNRDGQRVWGWGRYLGTGLLLSLFGAPLGGFLGYTVWALLDAVHFLLHLILGLGLDAESMRSSAQDWFIYIGAGIGFAGVWIYLWIDHRPR